MSSQVAARPILLPTVSYGPSRLMEAVPWLMLASAMRLVAYGGGLVAWPAMAVASVSLFLAFLLAARRMIELADGVTGLGRLVFADQMRLTARVLARVVAVLGFGWLALTLIGGGRLAPHFLYGFDGIAFDQATAAGMLWSGALAALVLLMVIQVGAGRPVSLIEAVRELAGRWVWLVPAVAAVGLFEITVNLVQAGARYWLWVFWQTSSAPDNIKNLVYFAFVVSFAAVRLWGVLLILTVALRQSYQRSRMAPAAPTDAAS